MQKFGKIANIVTIVLSFPPHRWSQAMPGIVKRPSLVEEAIEDFGDLFENKCQREHFANYYGSARRTRENMT